MRVLITHNYFLRLDAKQWKAQKPYPPLATLYAAAGLRNAGHETFFHDVQFENNAEHFQSVIKRITPDVVVLYEDGFNYLTKMCLTNMREAAFTMMGYAKQLGATVIVSGSDSTDHYQQYLEKGADVVIFGEGDETLLRLVDSQRLMVDSRQSKDDSQQSIVNGRQSTVNSQQPTVDNGPWTMDHGPWTVDRRPWTVDRRPWTNIPGIAYKTDTAIVTNNRGPVLKDLDSLPFPAWDLLDIKPYQKAWKKHGYFSINVATTRGCPFKCNWCAKPIYGNRYNSHSAEYIVSLIKHMRQYFAFDHIWFCDDIFGLKPGWVQTFSAEMQYAALRIPFKIQSRADLLVKDDTADALAKAGCEEVWIGAESGSQKVLDAMDKGTSIAQIKSATALLKKHGIKPCFFLQFGYPSENWDDIQSTLKMVDDLQPFDIGVSVSYPLPGTKFFENVKNDLNQKSNWTDSDELLLMYRGTFGPEFYKALHRYVHRRFRAAAARRYFVRKGNPKAALKYVYHKPLEWIEHRKTMRLLAAEQAS